MVTIRLIRSAYLVFNHRMPYAEGRTFFDADSHLMELPEWLPSYADPAFRDRIVPYSQGSTGTNDRVRAMIERGKRPVCRANGRDTKPSC